MLTPSGSEVKQERLLTGSKNIDLLLDGGLECGAITQFYGASKVGKTHLCHLLCVVLPLQYRAIYIDTQDGFSTKKIESIAQARGLNLSKILENIIVVKVDTAREQEQCIESLQNKMNSESGVKLLIVDSMTHLYRAAKTNGVAVTLYFETLGNGGLPSGREQDRLVLFVAGDDAAAKKVVSNLIEDIGFKAIDTGSLREGGRKQQPDSPIYNNPMIIEVARKRLSEMASRMHI